MHNSEMYIVSIRSRGHWVSYRTPDIQNALNVVLPCLFWANTTRDAIRIQRGSVVLVDATIPI